MSVKCCVVQKVKKQYLRNSKDIVIKYYLIVLELMS